MSQPWTIVLVVHHGLPALGADDEALGVSGCLAAVGAAKELAVGLTADRAFVMSEFACESKEELASVSTVGGGAGANCCGVRRFLSETHRGSDDERLPKGGECATATGKMSLLPSSS